MTLRVVGAGLARTGTASLKLALERLLGGPCYHMFELFARPEQVAVWRSAAEGAIPAWDTLFSGYRAAVDLPAAAFWPELAAASPQALIVLSVRDSPAQWWASASATVFNPARPAPPPDSPMAGFVAMITEVFRTRLGVSDLNDAAAMMAAYERHNAVVRASAPPGRLLQWRPQEGWDPLAAALGLPVPDDPFPKVNTREQFRDPVLGQHVRLRAEIGCPPGGDQ